MWKIMNLFGTPGLNTKKKICRIILFSLLFLYRFYSHFFLYLIYSLYFFLLSCLILLLFLYISFYCSINIWILCTKCRENYWPSVGKKRCLSSDLVWVIPCLFSVQCVTKSTHDIIYCAFIFEIANFWINNYYSIPFFLLCTRYILYRITKM
jgi:hypothetical protein